MPRLSWLVIGCCSPWLFVGCQSPTTHVVRYQSTAVAGPHQTAFLIVSKEQMHDAGQGPYVASSTPHAVIAFLDAPAITQSGSQFALSTVLSTNPHQPSITAQRVAIDHLEFDLSRGDLLVLAHSPPGPR